MTSAIVRLGSGTATKERSLDAYLDGAAAERAVAAANAWIKDLRHAQIDGQTLRRRFTVRDDSLWWFAELYLHKQRTIEHIFRTLAALGAMLDAEAPSEVELVRGGYLARGLVHALATARGIGFRGAKGFPRSQTVMLAAMEARAVSLNTAARASRLRGRASRPERGPRPAIAAFVHRAFWKSDAGEGSAEQYIGPVLAALEKRVGRSAIAYVSVGPASNFRARRWWDPLRGRTAADAHGAIEAFAPWSSLTDARRIWRERHAARRALWTSADVRERSIIQGCDCWPVVREELAGIALLQWPWSARAMDEAGAALDALRPATALTYAEAGGWGRALMLECRRRGIPSVGLQHGFIYRHWLNYLHEPDEMIADPRRPSDAGFPYPTATLLFDAYAAHHLAERGRFPVDALKVTGSPRLDALAQTVGTLTTADVDKVLHQTRAESRTLVLVTTKYKEAHEVLPALLTAAAALPGVQVAIKTHPAETPQVYEPLAANRPHVVVLDASAPLAPLLRASRAVVTVNSTVALDAAVLDIPALVIGLPNNLSPFVDAGFMAGVDGGQIGPMLQRILYDEEFRRELAHARRRFLDRFHIDADGRAAERAAEVIMGLTGG